MGIVYVIAVLSSMVIKGDGIYASIAVASILANHRDDLVNYMTSSRIIMEH